MRTRKELIYCNIKDLSQEEIEALADMRLNACDKCGEIEISNNLVYLEDEELVQSSPTSKLLLKQGFTVVCISCFEEWK